MSRDYKGEAIKARQAAVMTAIVAVHCENLRDQVDTKRDTPAIRKSMKNLFALAWAKVRESAHNIDDFAAGALHNAVMAECRAEAVESFEDETPTYLENTEACLKAARDECAYAEAVIRTCEKIAKEFDITIPTDEYDAERSILEALGRAVE